MTTLRCSTQEQSFELRILKVLANLAMMNTTYLPVKVTTSMITEEFPSRFLEAHGEMFALDCTFERVEFDLKWPIKITVDDYNNPEIGAVGWRDFMVDNSVEVGDILFISFLEMSRFLVQIVRKPSEQPFNLLPLSNEVAPCQNCWVAMRPWFMARVQNAFLEVPGWFWARHRELLQREEVELAGPNMNTMVVETKRAFLREQAQVVLSIRLDSGWDFFVVANQLQVGGYLLFVLVSPSRFRVDCF